MVILATSNIDMFYRGVLSNIDHRTRLQNEISLVADDICKSVSLARGNLTAGAITMAGETLTINTPTPISYTLTNYKIKKDGADLNVLPVVTSFIFNPLDYGIGVELNIAGKYNPSQAVTINNPEVNITTKCYSRQASSQ